jgi:hypothetical protein
VNNPSPSNSSADAVVVVLLRRPRKADPRTDPLYEFGSFGLTGCHGANLLADGAATGCRLAFAQGGPEGFRLVMLTPPVDVRSLGDRNEAFWSPAAMPLRYDAAPLLIDNAGRSDIAGIHQLIDGVARTTWEGQFSSAFRSRKRPLPTPLGAQIVRAWTEATRDASGRASFYWQALPHRPTRVDTDRRSTHRRLRNAAIGGPAPRRCR